MMQKTLLLSLLLITSLFFHAVAQVPLVYSEENTGAECEPPPLPDPSELTNYPRLPNPFAWSDGSGEVEDFEDWECRRNEIKSEIEEYEIGPKPARPAAITATYADGTLTVEITENGQTLTLSSTVTIPEGEGPFPVVIGMNNPTGSLPAELFEGVIQIPFMHNQVVTYSNTSNRNLEDPYYDLYPDLTYVGNYSAWSWGISRLIDGIELVQADLNADLDHISVTGCSYAGKMALFAGAYDERIALTIVQESGGGGINSWRVAETIGEVEKIGNTNYSWFMQSMKTNFDGKVGLLPHDHHELMAMVVPRALLVLGNPSQVWLGDESGYVASRAVQEVYKRFDIEDRFGFSFRTDHGHCDLPEESDAEVQAFIDKFLFEDETANTNVQYHDFYEVDYNYWIEAWKEPANPNAPAITIESSEEGEIHEAPITITIEATVTDINDDVAKVVFYNGQELLGEDTEAPFTFTLTDLGVGSYFVSAEAIDAEELKGYSNIVSILIQAPGVDVIYTDVPPTIDGTVDEIWNNETIMAIEATSLLVGADITADDFSGTAKMLWDNDNIYLLATVTDDFKVNDSPNTYEDDNVEFYFDFNNAKTSSYDSDDAQYSFAWNDGTAVGVLPSGRSAEGIIYKIADNDKGYVVEASIPWSTLGGTPENDKEVGLDFMINDDDDGGGRDAKLSWNAATDQAWQDASLFGTIRLVGGDNNPLSVNEESGKDKDGITVFPNPVNDLLKLDGISGEFRYEIFSISGRKLRSGEAQNSIDLGGLSKGVYILKVGGESPKQIKFIKE